MKIAVLGGGNGSFAAAGDLALAGHEVRLWRRNVGVAEAHRSEGGTILVKDYRGDHSTRLAVVTASMAEAVGGAALIICPLPAFAQNSQPSRQQCCCRHGRRRRRSSGREAAAICP